jgi:membrane protease YdiL (CAAX protease family)
MYPVVIRKQERILKMTTSSTVMSSSASGFKAFVGRNQLLVMYVIMFVLAWPGLVWEVLYSQGMAPSQSPVYVSIFTGWAPGIAAVVVTAIAVGKSGVKDLLGRFLVWKVGVQWYAVAFFLLAAVILGGIGMQVLFGGTVPAIPAKEASALNIALSFVIMIAFGFIINTEEIAWRGFALPRLQSKYGPLLAGILLVIPESLLHLPYFWNKDIDFYQTVGTFWFTAFSVAAVFIYTFVFNKTRGSLLLVTIMHASQNAWANLLSDNTARPFQFTVALMWMIALALIFLTKGKLGYEAD